MARVSIGDFAVMTSLSRKALRHYHDIGILEPVHIDSHTAVSYTHLTLPTNREV